MKLTLLTFFFLLLLGASKAQSAKRYSYISNGVYDHNIKSIKWFKPNHQKKLIRFDFSKRNDTITVVYTKTNIASDVYVRLKSKETITKTKSSFLRFNLVGIYEKTDIEWEGYFFPIYAASSGETVIQIRTADGKLESLIYYTNKDANVLSNITNREAF